MFEGSTMALRAEEKHAAEVFERWLAEKGRPEDRVTWEPVEADPPDLCFILERDGVQWAVEVTTLVQYVEFNGEERNINDFLFSSTACATALVGQYRSRPPEDI